MGVLANPKHERFAQALAAGSSADAAFTAAGLPRLRLADCTGRYVYVLIDPRSDRIFYVGKGTGDRARQHEREAALDRGVNEAKRATIRSIHADGLRAVIGIVGSGLTESEALRLERALIVRAHKRLVNISHGGMSEADRVKIIAWEGLRSIKPLCEFLRERPSAFRIAAWIDIVGDLAQASRDRPAW